MHRLTLLVSTLLIAALTAFAQYGDLHDDSLQPGSIFYSNATGDHGTINRSSEWKTIPVLPPAATTRDLIVVCTDGDQVLAEDPFGNLSCAAMPEPEQDSSWLPALDTFHDVAPSTDREIFDKDHKLVAVIHAGKLFLLEGHTAVDVIQDLLDQLGSYPVSTTSKILTESAW
jgi:hypothetical protein